MVTQHAIRVSFGEMSCAQTSLHVYFSNLLIPCVSAKEAIFGLFVGIGPHVNEGVKEIYILRPNSSSLSF